MNDAAESLPVVIFDLFCVNNFIGFVQDLIHGIQIFIEMPRGEADLIEQLPLVELIPYKRFVLADLEHSSYCFRRIHDAGLV